MARVISGCQSVPLDLGLARSVGELCGGARTMDIVDASVVAVTSARGDDILTSDPADFKRLTALVKGAGRIRDLTALGL